MKTNIWNAISTRDEIKEKYGRKCVVIFRNEERYEMYGDDSLTFWHIDINFARRTKVQYEETKDEKGYSVRLCTFEQPQIHQVMSRLVRNGERVCIIDAPVQ